MSRPSFLCAAQYYALLPTAGGRPGQRLHEAFQWSHERAFQRTIVIGSDSPHISLETMDKAQAALDKADVVLGPAEDGGYYLIAMRKPHDVFSGIPMSTSSVDTMTIELAQSQGLNRTPARATL